MFATLSSQSICQCVYSSADKLSPACGPNHRKVFKTKLYVYKLLLEYPFIMWILNSNSTWNEASFDWPSFMMLFRVKIFIYPRCVFIGKNGSLNSEWLVISVKRKRRIKAKLSLMSDNNSNWLFATLENKNLTDITNVLLFFCLFWHPKYSYWNVLTARSEHGPTNLFKLLSRNREVEPKCQLQQMNCNCFTYSMIVLLNNFTF